MHSNSNDSITKSRPTKEEICARIFKVGANTNSDSARTDPSNVSNNLKNSESTSGERVKSNVSRTKQLTNNRPPLILPQETKPPDLSSDSDDSCIILDNVPKPKHLQINSSKSIFNEESEYRHKMNALS